MGRVSQQDAADDAELERIMSMTEDELVKSMGGREAFDTGVGPGARVFRACRRGGRAPHRQEVPWT